MKGQRTRTGYTPGPYQAVQIDTAKINIRAGEDSIALVYRHLGSPTLHDRQGEGEANARLFAAAPELVEALTFALSVLHDIADEAGDVPFWNDGGAGRVCCQQARALLARIDGTACTCAMNADGSDELPFDADCPVHGEATDARQGALLARTCRVCGTTLTAGDRTLGNCGMCKTPINP